MSGMSVDSKDIEDKGRSLGIYVHVPFCKSRCTYCDFISSIDSSENRNKYTQYLQRQTQLSGRRYGGSYVVDTLYFGGGTPTLLDKEQFNGITQKIFSSFKCDIKEFTVEANPCTVTDEKLAYLKDCGVSRLSLGVQSFDDSLLRMLGRRHSADEAKTAIALAKKYCFDVSADAMIGLPNQKISDIKNFVDIAGDLGVDHISVYMLSVEDGTVLHRQIREGKLAEKTDDEIADFYEYACRRLQESGYERYEISNFCKNGKKSLHNLRYWQCKDYLGLGMGAHSLLDGERWRNAETFEEYYKAVDNDSYRIDIQKLSEIDKEREYIMLGFRLSDGISLTQFENFFNCNFLEKYKNALEKNKNYLQINSNSVSIKYEYLQLMNSIIIDFI